MEDADRVGGTNAFDGRHGPSAWIQIAVRPARN